MNKPNTRRASERKHEKRNPLCLLGWVFLRRRRFAVLNPHHRDMSLVLPGARALYNICMSARRRRLLHNCSVAMLLNKIIVLKWDIINHFLIKHKHKQNIAHAKPGGGMYRFAGYSL